MPKFAGEPAALGRQSAIEVGCGTTYLARQLWVEMSTFMGRLQRL
jgi:hypothetical protein